MRVYIKDITSIGNELRPDNEYDFIEFVECAMSWNTAETAEVRKSMICNHGNIIKAKDRSDVYYTDFQVEPRPQGRFVISCEYLFSCG